VFFPFIFLREKKKPELFDMVKQIKENHILDQCVKHILAKQAFELFSNRQRQDKRKQHVLKLKSGTFALLHLTL
jgi:hypothetical protein